MVFNNFLPNIAVTDTIRFTLLSNEGSEAEIKADFYGLTWCAAKTGTNQSDAPSQKVAIYGPLRPPKGSQKAEEKLRSV